MAGLASDLRSPIGHINIMHQKMPGTSGNVRIGQINTFLAVGTTAEVKKEVFF